MQKWESDHAKPSVDNLIILSQTLNVSLDKLLTGCTERVRDEKRRAGVRPDYPSLHPWELYSEELMVEFRQSCEEDIDIGECEELFKAVSHLPGGEYKERIADVMFDIVSRTPIKKDYEFDEPSELDEIKLCRGTVHEKRGVDKSRLRAENCLGGFGCRSLAPGRIRVDTDARRSKEISRRARQEPSLNL